MRPVAHTIPSKFLPLGAWEKAPQGIERREMGSEIPKVVETKRNASLYNIESLKVAERLFDVALKVKSWHDCWLSCTSMAQSEHMNSLVFVSLA